MQAETRERIQSLIESSEVVLFMKGDRMSPQCGFSARVVQMLDGVVTEYATVDVLSDPDVREGIKEFSSWPTIPQLYVKGEFVGGCDIITDLYSSGELHKMLGLEAPARVEPKIKVSDSAAKNLREHLERTPGRFLHLSIDANYRASLGLGGRQGGEIEATDNGITFLLDPMSAQRADGITIDIADTPQGPAFRIDNPNAPSPVKEMSPAELKRLMQSGSPFQLFDVRTPEERAIARIEGARLLDAETAQYIESLPKDSMLVFHCHHGGRSQQAAEHFRERGFTNVHNLVGGIDAWSQQVAPEVPRY